LFIEKAPHVPSGPKKLNNFQPIGKHLEPLQPQLVCREGRNQLQTGGQPVMSKPCGPGNHGQTGMSAAEPFFSGFMATSDRLKVMMN